MDPVRRTHTSANDGADNGFVTMGYFTRARHRLLLRAGRRLHDLRRLLLLGPRARRTRTGSCRSRRNIDPAGTAGGPVRRDLHATARPTTGPSGGRPCPSACSAAGVSWKVYNDPTALFELSPFPYFKLLRPGRPRPSPSWSRTGSDPDLPGGLRRGRGRRARCRRCPGSCRRSPSASTPPRRPSTASTSSSQVLSTLVSNPDIWATTVLIITYDENGGFFDHVPPPTAAGRDRRAST